MQHNNAIDLITAINNGENNANVLNGLSNRKSKSIDKWKALIAPFLLLFLRVVKGKGQHSEQNELGFHWSNHHVSHKPESVQHINYSQLDSFTRDYSLIRFLKDFCYLISQVLLSKRNRTKLECKDIRTIIFYCFEYCILHQIISQKKWDYAFSFGTFCRRMQMIGLICKENQVPHHVFQHGAFRTLVGIRTTFASKVFLYFSNDRELLQSYFKPMSLESTIKVEVLDREKKFIQASFEFSENSVFYATNPNHEDENFFVIDSLIKYGAWDTIIVSPHPRENIENYISKYANSNVVVTKEKVSGCKNYIFRPSTIIVEALEESIRPIVYISDMDRVEHYVDSKKSLVVLGQHEFKNLIRSKSYE